MTLSLLIVAMSAGLQPAPAASPAKPDTKQAQPEAAKPLLPFPHPLITEVLCAVPTGEGGDANKDGTRQVAGDEFVEIINPHDKPITLGGYTLSDMTAQEKTTSGKPKSGAVRWTFPPCTLKPGEVALVFNGHASSISGVVGDSSAGPRSGNESFGGAMVFSMRQPTDRVAFANTADWVLLSGPDGKPVHLIKWGEPRIKVPDGVLLVEEAPTSRNGSVQRTVANGALAPHPTDGRVSFSPGVFVMPRPATEPAPTDKPAPTAKPGENPPAKPDTDKPADPPASTPPTTPAPKKQPKF